jgi:hypothetical protein
MYLTAQRVRTREGAEGINTFLFMHRNQLVPGMSWEAPDVALVAEQHPGAVIVQRLELEAGGNDVLSYLDVVADDAFGLTRLRAALSATSFEPGRGATWSLGPVAFRFFMANANPRDERAELQALREHALLLLRVRGGGAPSVTAHEPLQIVAEDEAGLGVVYRLDPGSERRLRELRPGSISATLNIAYEDRSLLASLWGSDEYHQQIALALTGLSDHELARLGGVRVIDLHRQLSPAVIARSEELDGQVTGDWFGPEEEPEALTGWPTGALLRSGELALDLVYIEQAWFPLSEAGIHTCRHAAGLAAGETWRFRTRSQPATVYRVSLGPSIARRQVAAVYGDDAAARARPDHRTVQLRLVQE